MKYHRNDEHFWFVDSLIREKHRFYRLDKFMTLLNEPIKKSYERNGPLLKITFQLPFRHFSFSLLLFFSFDIYIYIYTSAQYVLFYEWLLIFHYIFVRLVRFVVRCVLSLIISARSLFYYSIPCEFNQWRW